ncbi:MAG: DUF5672 family protein [Zoogloea sp.]|uniref:DUF5672 family protein n=1 Tax=Zoogloea sp. TaxID=49181 RepID=UPI0026175576|nr:DUF5672 family protein [Zoogloea sp.]MDD3327074.1 DUF5672 family protein [Zoogloea sp.]
MLALPDVSLLCLDTRHPDLAFKAMQRCLDRARFREAVLLTRDGYRSPDPRITARTVPTLRNVAEYSHFMVKSLGPYFSGSHVLIMQWDSFIVDPQAWDAAFLDYDYIGAPWPHRSQPVGNGGFSLRSRRLIDALQDADIRETQPEDHVICLDYHDLLVARHGIRFAPADVASRFAFELTPPKGPTFGFHGFFNFHLAMPDAELRAWLAGAERSVLLSMPGRRLLKNLIGAGRHESARLILDVRAGGNLKQRLDTFKLRCRLALRRLR